MIDTIKMTPIEYSAQSRDYQVIARLYTALFNLSKMYIDNNHFWTNDIDKKLSRLRSFTLNFRNKYDWDLDELKVVSSCFKYLMFRKGTKTALMYCIYILMRIKNLEGVIKEDVAIEIVDNLITIRIPEYLTNLGAIEDLIRYLIPAGFTYRVIKYIEFTPATDDIVKLSAPDSIEYNKYKSAKITIKASDQDIIDSAKYMGTKVTAGTSGDIPDIPYGEIGTNDYLPGSIGNTVILQDDLFQTDIDSNTGTILNPINIDQDPNSGTI